MLVAWVTSQAHPGLYWQPYPVLLATVVPVPLHWRILRELPGLLSRPVTPLLLHSHPVKWALNLTLLQPDQLEREPPLKRPLCQRLCGPCRVGRIRPFLDANFRVSWAWEIKGAGVVGLGVYSRSLSPP